MKKINAYMAEHMEMLNSDAFTTAIAALAATGILVLFIVV